MKHLVIFSHSFFEKSRINKALLNSVVHQNDLEVRNLNALYPNGKIDTQTEIEALKKAKNIYFQFPLFWFSTPSLLKEWEDCVLTAILYGNNPKMLEGKIFRIITSAGGTKERYDGDGGLEKLLSPIQSSFLYTGAKVELSHIIYNAHHLQDLEAEVRKYQKIFS